MFTLKLSTLVGNLIHARHSIIWEIQSVIQPHLFGGGRGRRRTCGQRCKRRKSRRTSPGHPAEVEWESAPGCSSPDPTQNEKCIWILTRDKTCFAFLKSLELNLQTLWGIPVLPHHTDLGLSGSDAATLHTDVKKQKRGTQGWVRTWKLIICKIFPQFFGSHNFTSTADSCHSGN